MTTTQLEPPEPDDHCHLRRNEDGTLEITSSSETFTVSREAIAPLIEAHNRVVKQPWMLRTPDAPNLDIYPPVESLLAPGAHRYAIEWFSQDPPDLSRLAGSFGQLVCTALTSHPCSELEGYQSMVGWSKNREVWEVH